LQRQNTHVFDTVVQETEPDEPQKEVSLMSLISTETSEESDTLVQEQTDDSVFLEREETDDLQKERRVTKAVRFHSSAKKGDGKELWRSRDESQSPLAHRRHSCIECNAVQGSKLHSLVRDKIRLEVLFLEQSMVQVGDLVLLGDGMPQEFRSSRAIVTKVAESYFTVDVLDEFQRRIGKCCPGLQDVSIINRDCRLGSHVVIEGMQRASTRHLNGLKGVVSKDPRRGHPMYVKKKACPNTPILALCIVFDNPELAKEPYGLLEPRFLKRFDADRWP